ncbi:tail fiber assembly protein [Escherichia coli]|uniref:tail fiber assembly protein n=1 Tax=Escherichia coli TaxID=562 RepID=UPI001260C7D9|nr:tail fiber assembly protein [Escherichia coli]HAJ3973688.1 phage tail protein [Escherichia coli]HAJ4002923.1 phage tail protein [Escherichia coli]HAJ4470848.1 phage tail protein [Escherichia coli]HAJ4584457.1 phage tail protein [Escherichia coli]HAJ4645896.1 phage tail protein [Escherichia coli]
MNKFYKGSFYPEALKEVYINAGSWPENGVDVDDETMAIYTSVAPKGKILGADKDGNPTWLDIPPPNHEELIRIAENEQKRLLTHADAVMLDWRTELMLGEISDANKAKLSAWMAYKNEVKAIDATTAPEHVNWPVPPDGGAIRY